MAKHPTNTYELPYTIDDRIAQANACGYTGPSGYRRFMDQLYQEPEKIKILTPIQWPQHSHHRMETCILPSQFPNRQTAVPPPEPEPEPEREPEQPSKYCPRFRRERICDCCGIVTPSAQLRFLHYNPSRAADFAVCDGCYSKITQDWLLDQENRNYIQGPQRTCMQCRRVLPVSILQVIYSRRSKAAGAGWRNPKKCGMLCQTCRAGMEKQLNR